MTAQVWIIIAVVAAIVLIALVVGTVLYRRRRISLVGQQTETRAVEDRSGNYRAGGGFSFSEGGVDTAPPPVPVQRTDADGQPRVGDDASVPRDAPKRPITEVRLPEAPPETPVAPETAEAPVASAETLEQPAPETEAPAQTGHVTEVPGHVTEVPGTAPLPAPETPADIETGPPLDEIEPTEGRLNRLRGRLSRSQSAVGKSLLGLLGGGDLDEDSWEEVEDTLLVADLGSAVTEQVVSSLREQMASHTVRTEADARSLLRKVLIEQLHPELNRSIRALPHSDHPSILLVVGVNGTGKTTTTGKLARVLVADGRRVLLGAADTFRAAAADQLQTWGQRVGADTVRGKEQADPAAVAFDAVVAGTEAGVDAVLIDTAGRLHTKTGLMDELGKVKRVVEKKASVDEVLLVLDATIGQNGLMQARVFADVVDITGVVLTKLDGTAKGGIVFQVQHELGVPVKLVGLGEGADDLAPFEPAAFVDALLG